MASSNLPAEPGKQYEFTQSENQVIGGLAGKMRIVGIFTLALGVLYLAAAAFQILAIPQARAAHLLPAVSTVIAGLIYLAVGCWTLNAASSFRLIVTTQGSDIR